MAITSFSKLITPRQPLLTPYTYRDNRFHKVHITFHRVQLDETFIGGKIKTGQAEMPVHEFLEKC